jgi:hypothetical protein
MSVRSAQSVTKVFTTRRFDTGAATNADSTPAGTLYVNGTANGATVTVTNITTGVYKAAVTLPTLAVGDVVDLRISATVNAVTDNAVVWVDAKDIVIDSAGLADANTVKLGPSGSGTAQTARDIGASVLLSTGTGAGQLDFTSGVVKSNLVQILGTVLTETAGQIAAAFKKLFDVSGPVLTAQSVNQTGDSFGRIGAAGAGLTSLGDTRIAFLDAAVSTRSTYAGADTSGTTTLLTRLTGTRATNLDNLDAAVSTRLATSGYTSPLASAVQQAVASLVWGYTSFLFVNKSGNDTTGDGLTPATAYLTVFKATSAAAAFTAIVVGPGVYDEGTHTLTVPTDGALIGAGRDNTTIQAQTVSTGLAGVIVKPSTRCKITDLTIQGNAASGVSQVPLGVESFDPGFTNARFERLRVIADADGIYVSGSVCSFVAEDVQIDTNYDCFAFFSPVTCTLRRVSARALGPSGVSSGVTARALNNQSASSVINAYDCSFLAQDATTTTTGIENAAGGTIRLFGNTSVRASSGSGTVKDIVSGNNVTAAGSVVYDATKLTGTVTAAGAPAQDYARLLNPTSTLNLSGTTVGTLTTYTGNTPQTGDAYARIGAAGAGLTALGDTRIAFLDASILSRMATFSYTAPDNTTIAAINNKLPSTTNATLTSLASMITANKFTVAALSNAPTGSGGGSAPAVTIQDQTINVD